MSISNFFKAGLIVMNYFWEFFTSPSSLKDSLAGTGWGYLGYLYDSFNCQIAAMEIHTGKDSQRVIV